MNERIKLLAEQCYEHDQSWTGVGQRIFNKEKFAELIVRECVGICNDTNDATYLNGVIAGRKIKQHFGVEE